MNNTIEKVSFGSYKKKKKLFDLLNNQDSVTSYCRQMIITIQAWIKKLILQGLEMRQQSAQWRSPGPETEREWCLWLISAAARLGW